MSAQPPIDSMYAAHEKVYPREIKGRYQNIRKLKVFLLLGLFYIVPWLRIDGNPAVLFDLPARQFHILWLTFWPQDFVYLTLLLIVSAVALFYVTALAGRVWCGYACPQTVWTEVFLWMEQWTEGKRAKRMKLDKGPWNAEKILRKSAKQVLWLSFALWTGFTFVGFFVPIDDLLTRAVAFELGPWETFWSLFYGFATYGNAGFLREQVCLYMCPYARFQGAMFDRETLVISYDEARGEPRGGRKRGIDPKTRGLGDCIDCNLCVQVCPTGIDIRKGLQYECIACGACIDACDQVMDKMEYPRGLVRYTTENALEGKPSRVIRPRTILYTVLLLALLAAGTTGLVLREPVRLDILTDRNTLYRETVEGLIENSYTIKLTNMSRDAQTFVFSASGPENVMLETEPTEVTLGAGETRTLAARIQLDPIYAQGVGGDDVTVTAQSVGEKTITTSETTRFRTPLGR
ncbi:cytochrome c oxidase accessory protein CcoG [Spiribacter sp. C176]|uniref:Cytochrome c oxidase accessory protein CcoG n=1 Tax=Spiribacter salilacus TaxID=2664894 RepID=A0A6N7QR02_9GAMM|nr:cytochrome c oxidase accessory protein CcoG [Spiribacter salilacus]MRH78945.1 cytochrome c oxidase accessory protein CcoG [Spiribacter salilacus]